MSKPRSTAQGVKPSTLPGASATRASATRASATRAPTPAGRRRTRPTATLPPGCSPDSILLTFRVAPEQAGLRLDRYVQTRIPRLSRTRAQEVVKACAYRDDGTRRRPSERVRAGETVLLVRPPFPEPNAPKHFEVLYDDEDMLVVDKPSGLPVHPSATYHKNTLTYVLRERYPKSTPHIAHRLDRETSGVLVCARTLDAERVLKNAFETRKVSKRYLAIARGEIADDEGTIPLPLARAKEGLHILMEVCGNDEGRMSLTSYRVVARRPGATLVLLKPEHGRQHQLRVHLQAIGHPIVGDKLYGPEGVAPFMDFIETGMTPALRERLGHERQALHAFELDIEHPRTGNPMTLRSPLPRDLRQLWDAPLPAW